MDKKDAEPTTTLQLTMPVEVLSALDKLVAMRAPHVPTLYEWSTKHKAGKDFFHMINTSPKYKAMSAKEVNELQRKMYQEDVGLARGRPRLHDIRVQVITEALEQYTKLHAVKQAA